jgi:hypothetical protein
MIGAGVTAGSVQKRRGKIWISRQRAAVLMCQLVLCAGLALQAATAIAAEKQTQTTIQKLVPKELPKALPTVTGTLDPSSLTVGFGQKFTILGSCSGGLNAWLNSDPQGAFGNEIVDAGGGKSKWFGIARQIGQSKVTLRCYAGNDLSTATGILATAVVTVPPPTGTLDPSSLTVGFGQPFTVLGSCSSGANAWLNSDPQGAFGNEIVDAGGGKSKWFGIAKLAGQSKITLRCYAGNDLSTATDVLATAVITVPDLRSAQDAYTKAKAAVAKLQSDLAASQAALDQAKLVCQQTPGCVAN